MPHSHYEQYLAAEVSGADPIKLVHMLYRGAMEAVGAARRHLAAGDIRERSRELMRAWEILRELNGSLDHVHGGEISRRLAGLYAYMQTRLLEANQRQIDAPMLEVEDLLKTLEEAWRGWKLDPTTESYDSTPVACTY